AEFQAPRSGFRARRTRRRRGERRPRPIRGARAHRASAASPSPWVRPRATAAGRTPSPFGYRSSSTHLLGRSNAHQSQTAANNLRDSQREFQTRARKLWIIFNEEAPGGIVVAAVPERVELGRKIVEIERDPV